MIQNIFPVFSLTKMWLTNKKTDFETDDTVTFLRMSLIFCFLVPVIITSSYIYWQKNITLYFEIRWKRTSLIPPTLQLL